MEEDVQEDDNLEKPLKLLQADDPRPNEDSLAYLPSSTATARKARAG